MTAARFIPPKVARDDFSFWELGLAYDERNRPSKKILQAEAHTVARLANPQRGVSIAAQAGDE